MKLTKETLKRIIKEELEATMEEGFFDFLKKKEEPIKTSVYEYYGGDKDAYNRGKTSAEFGNERPSAETIAKITMHSGSFTPEERRRNVINFLKGFDNHYDPNRTPRPPREEPPEVPDYERHDYDQQYRDAMSASGVGVGALSMPSDSRRRRGRGRGR